jgi:hypothetical protein
VEKVERMILKAAKTTHNRIVYASGLKALGLQKTPVGLTPFVGFSLRHIFTVAGMLAHSFIATVKTSYTTGTLSDIHLQIFWKNNGKY